VKGRWNFYIHSTYVKTSNIVLDLVTKSIVHFYIDFTSRFLKEIWLFPYPYGFCNPVWIHVMKINDMICHFVLKFLLYLMQHNPQPSYNYCQIIRFLFLFSYRLWLSQGNTQTYFWQVMAQYNHKNLYECRGLLNLQEFNSFRVICHTQRYNYWCWCYE